jgi:hypothetical protein
MSHLVSEMRLLSGRESSSIGAFFNPGVLGVLAAPLSRLSRPGSRRQDGADWVEAASRMKLFPVFYRAIRAIGVCG